MTLALVRMLRSRTFIATLSRVTKSCVILMETLLSRSILITLVPNAPVLAALSWYVSELVSAYAWLRLTNSFAAAWRADAALCIRVLGSSRLCFEGLVSLLPPLITPPLPLLYASESLALRLDPLLDFFPEPLDDDAMDREDAAADADERLSLFTGISPLSMKALLSLPPRHPFILSASSICCCCIISGGAVSALI